MRPLSLWVGVGALAVVAIVAAACSGASSQAPTATPGSLGAAAGPGTATSQLVEGTVIPAPPPKREAEVIHMGPRDVRAVALTFDTGVAASYTSQILDVLKEHGVPATFGITGEWAVSNPALLKRIVEEGHALINHSWSHPSFTGEGTGTPPLTADQIRDELRRTEEKVQEAAQASTKPYFRPPYGDFDRLVNQVAREEGYEYNVLWTLDARGWQGSPTETVVAVTLAQAANGAIFLYHVDNSREYKALEEIIEGLDERGLGMVTIPQLLGKEPLPTRSPTSSPIATPTSTPTPPPRAASAPAPSPPSEPAPRPAPTRTPAPTPTPTPIPTPAYTRVAFDDFESESADGGSGWLAPWRSTDPFITSGGAPHAGDRQLDLSSGRFVFRMADLAAYEKVHLRFWSRLTLLDASHQALVLVRPGGGLTWEVAKEFTMTESDEMYHLYDIDLTGMGMSDSFAVGFYRLMDPLGEQWHIDDVELGGFVR